ncbi:hypothetical protein BCR43DRAFT_495693 [Syncephalastrum racemosum]|uniref:DUF1348-domain-containing protein n=1 Tax=Syncephalastrum racemosum TaxID=13706 RepID=A0A1X2H6A8_SYNRA|nr:hypothetical protein BCR43DRAFT_495693 [Syncephalastrum racemosum]
MADIKPPFTLETAQKKVKFAQDMWNTCDPERVYKAYTEDSIWRNRDNFFTGHESIKQFLKQKWETEHRYRLRKELFAFMDDKIAVQFWYEFVDNEGQWWRCYGLEDWTFDIHGKMRKRQMSGNNLKITEKERWFHEGVRDVNAVSISEEHW